MGPFTNMAWVLVSVFFFTIFQGPEGYEFLPCLNNGYVIHLRDDQICCSGTIELKDDRRGKDCCYDLKEFYYKTSALCCEGRLWPNTDGQLGCCNNETYNTSTNFCCGRELHSRDSYLGCCGHSTYDRDTEMCCQDPINASLVTLSEKSPLLACCGHRVMDSSLRKCSDVNGKPEIIFKQQSICGHTKIDLTSQSCCLGTVYNVSFLDPRNPHKKNPVSSCCGNVQYNPKTHICCLSQFILPKSEHLMCCGSGSVDIRHQRCCEDHVVNMSAPVEQCCGRSLIDPNKQGCCHRSPFYNHSHWCCRSQDGLNGEVLEIGNEQCCGGRQLKENQLCCSDLEPVNKTRGDHDQCCEKVGIQQSTFTTFNSKKQACFAGTVVTRMQPNDKDCGVFRYSPDRAVCCDGHVHRFPPGQTLACCQGMDYSEALYNTDTQMCCNGALHNVSQSQYECCGFVPYNKDKGDNPCKICDPSQPQDPHMTCCEGRRFVKSIFGDKCCGKRAYSSALSTCCNGYLYDVPKDNKACCGNKLYNPLDSQCTSGEMIALKQGCSSERYGSLTLLVLTFISIIGT